MLRKDRSSLYRGLLEDVTQQLNTKWDIFIKKINLFKYFNMNNILAETNSLLSPVLLILSSLSSLLLSLVLLFSSVLM